MGVLFGCGQGVVFVPEIDSGKLAPMDASTITNYMRGNYPHSLINRSPSDASTYHKLYEGKLPTLFDQ